MKDDQKSFLKATTGMDTIPFVSAGIAAETDGYVISEDGITKLVEAAMSNGSAATKISQLESQVNSLTAEKSTLQTEKTTLETKVTGLEAQVTELGKLDAGKITLTAGQAEKKDTDAPEMSATQKELDAKAKNL